MAFLDAVPPKLHNHGMSRGGAIEAEKRGSSPASRGGAGVYIEGELGAAPCEEDKLKHAVLSGTAIVAFCTLLAFGAKADDTKLIKGQCGPESHIAEGPIGQDLTKLQSRFFCDAAVVTVFSDDPKHVMIQFADSKSHHARQIGYAGVMEDEQILNVHGVYLEPGRSTPVVEGYCKLFFEAKGFEKTISSIACGAKIDEADRRTVPVITFKADSSTFSTPPNSSLSVSSLPPYNKSGVANCSLPGTIINFALNGQGGAQVARIESNYAPFRAAVQQTRVWRAGLTDKDGTRFLVLDNGRKTRIMVRLPDGKGMAFSADGGVSDILCQILVTP